MNHLKYGVQPATCHFSAKNSTHVDAFHVGTSSSLQQFCSQSISHFFYLMVRWKKCTSKMFRFGWLGKVASEVWGGVPWELQYAAAGQGAESDQQQLPMLFSWIMWTSVNRFLTYINVCSLNQAIQGCDTFKAQLNWEDKQPLFGCFVKHASESRQLWKYILLNAPCPKEDEQANIAPSTCEVWIFYRWHLGRTTRRIRRTQVRSLGWNHFWTSPRQQSKFRSTRSTGNERCWRCRFISDLYRFI